MVIQVLAIVGPLVFTNNVLMSFIKLLAGKAAGKVWLRGILLGLSVLGVISMSALTGNTVDFNQITDLTQALVEILLTAFGAHFTYRLIKEA